MMKNLSILNKVSVYGDWRRTLKVQMSLVYNRLYYQRLPAQTMKIRFMSKKQREDLKNQQQPSHDNRKNSSSVSKANVSEINQSSEDNSNIPPTNRQEQAQTNRQQYFALPSKPLTKHEIQQRDEMKNQYMGLKKQKLSSRHDKNYKSKLLFEWDKSEDTSKGRLNQLMDQPLGNWSKNNKEEEVDQAGSWKDKKYGEMTERDWRIFRQDMEIYIKGGKTINPFREWSELSALNPQLLHRLAQLRFVRPRPIQMQSIPIGMTSRDLVAIAPTGQGKTLGYLMPAFHFIEPLEKLTAQNSSAGPYALILVPSRELAEQIVDQFQKINVLGMTAVRVVGGMQIDLQAIQLQKGCEIIIGTPGRLKELVQKHYLSLNRCSWVVIDEADKMISENLVEDVEWILDSLGSESLVTYESHGKKRVTSMFSATMVPQIEKLTKNYLVNPIYVTIGEVGRGKKEIEQHIELIDEREKNDYLRKTLKNLPGPIMVFVNTRVKCDTVVKFISRRLERSCCDYHGGKNQEARQKVIQQFRANKFQILVATDLGGRGLDIKGINAVISYDGPKNISEFIHRAGRSGRAGVKGKAFTFLTTEDEDIFYDVRTFMQRNEFKMPENFKEHPAAQVKPGTLAQIARRKQIVYTN